MKITKAASNPLAQKFEPRVISTAKPEADWLLQARRDINSDESLRDFFRRAREEGRDSDWIADNISVRLAGRWGSDRFFDALEAATYLADEYLQLGEGIHIVSTETGKITATLSESDIYQPAPVPRESGGLAVPLPRIRPDLEGLLTTWSFERGREEQLTEALALRANQTDLLREEGDPRLRIATRSGRSEIVREIAEDTPRSLLERAGGSAAAFLRHFEIRTAAPDPSEGLEEVHGVASAQSRMGIQDPLTTNLHHNRQGILRGVFAQAWAREMARRLSVEAHQRGSVPPVPSDQIGLSDFSGTDMWVVSPDALQLVRELSEKQVTLMPVEGAYPLGLSNRRVGVLVLPESFSAESRELFNRWETAAILEFSLWVDWSAIRVLRISDVPLEPEVVLIR